LWDHHSSTNEEFITVATASLHATASTAIGSL